MRARLASFELAPEERDVGATVYANTVDVISALGGFRGMLVLTDPEGARVTVLTLWETAEDLARAEPALDAVKQAETAFRNVLAIDTRRFDVTGMTWR